MRKTISVLLIIILLFIPCGCQSEKPMTIGLIPLDSRPCNTQYPEQLAQMAGWQVLLPDNHLLDSFTTPSDSAQLWQWLYETDCDKYILFTNQLLNGGLIHSRSLGTYRAQDNFFAQLDTFLEAHPNSDITIISVLPRLLPSQYDEFLWQYQRELSAYGNALDKALQESTPAPIAPENVPVTALEQYLALYETNYTFLQKLTTYAKDNLSLIIGQDDAQQYCPSNIIYRALGKIDNPNLFLLHGADELTMLAVASYQSTPASINIIFSNTDDTTRYYPYEAADLTTILSEKMAYLNITIDPNAKDTLIIHTDPQQTEQTKTLLHADYNGYLALADIAYTNKGDIALIDSLFHEDIFQKLHCYSGWNTASNTLGTVLAHYQISRSYAHTDFAAKSALEFKLTRYSEDLIYQGIISNPLRSKLLQEGQMEATTAFIDAQASGKANSLLTERFLPYGTQLQQLIQGEQTVLPNHTVAVTDATYAVTFPWPRAFEICAQWDITLP